MHAMALITPIVPRAWGGVCAGRWRPGNAGRESQQGAHNIKVLMQLIRIRKWESDERAVPRRCRCSLPFAWLPQPCFLSSSPRHFVHIGIVRIHMHWHRTALYGHLQAAAHPTLLQHTHAHGRATPAGWQACITPIIGCMCRCLRCILTLLVLGFKPCMLTLFRSGRQAERIISCMRCYYAIHA